MKKTFIVVIMLIVVVSAIETSEFYKNKFYNRPITWQSTQTDNFVIVFSEESKDVAAIAAQFAEDAYDFCAQTLNSTVPDTITLIVYPSSYLFSQNSIIPSILPPNVAGFATFEKDRVVVPFNGDLAAFQELLYHEIMHIFEYHILYKNPLTAVFAKRHNIPTWVLEGLSEYATNNTRNPKFMVVKDAAQHGYLHSAEFFEQNQPLDYLGYQQAYAIIRFMVDTWGERKLLTYVKELTTTLDNDEAIKKTYDIRFKELYARWHAQLTDTLTTYNNSLPSVFTPTATILHQGALYIPFSESTFYLTIENGALVRKIIDNDEYREIVYRPSVFAYFNPDTSLITVSEDGSRCAYVYFENGSFHVGLYNFITQQRTARVITSFTGVYSLSFYNERLLLLGRDGTRSQCLDITDTTEVSLSLPHDNVAFMTAASDTSFIYASLFGHDTFLFVQDLIYKVSGTLLALQSISSNEVMLLINEGTINRLYRFELETGTLTPLRAFRETMVSFSLHRDSLNAVFFHDRRYLYITTTVPEQQSESSETALFLKAPLIADYVNYDPADMPIKKYKDPLTFSQSFFGIDIIENTHVQLRAGMLLDSVLNEHQLFAYTSFFVTDSAPLDFGVAYITSGNRPAYSFWLEKNTLFRNDKPYYTNQLSARVHYPLSFFASVHAKAGAYLTGRDIDALDDVLYAGIYGMYDSSYGRLYPDMGIRAYTYAGLVSGELAGYEIESDLRLYYMPFMVRGYFRHSPLMYHDDTYIRGFRDTYFATENKIAITAEMRTPLVSAIPLFTRAVRLPTLSLFMFADIGLFTDSLRDAVFMENNQLRDGVMSIGCGLTMHLSRMLTLDATFAYPGDLKTFTKEPVIEFSVSKTFY